ncbi:uncharacterized protein LOC127839568 [Dreissena polymorpha]|uniref:uncharacterized protein LOC127839568 n=1 Tax=Dreissena polymorpha TaxID=45954 RepID=UPI0022646F48|nr:uncharacterized protein LOC127839568 [Dreissena polymorpha]
MSTISIIVNTGSMELFKILRCTSIGILDLGTADCVLLASEMLHTLNKLTKLTLRGTYTSRCDLRLPASLQSISLHEVKCTSEWLCSLLITLSSFDHPVKCELLDVVLQPCEEACGDYSHTSGLRSEILLRNMSTISLFVNTGSMELFKILRCISIGILDLGTADCVLLASEMLHTLNKLTKLTLRGTYTGRCDLRLPASLQSISLHKVKCTSEWLCSLLFTLSSFNHPVEFWLFDVVLQPCEEACGDYSHTSGLRSEILLRNMSTISLFVKTGSMELFKILRCISIGILNLGTADCVLLASEMLHTFNKLTQLSLRGTFTARCDLRLPASLPCISLQEVKSFFAWYLYGSMRSQTACFVAVY